MRKPLLSLLLVLAAALGGGWWLTAAKRAPGDIFDGLTGSAEAGRQVFLAAGCASCHAAPGASGDAMRVLAGGRAFKTDFGTFYAPNISPSLQGIGGWSALDLYNAIAYGTSPSGQHLYPALPYTSYRDIAPRDALSLYAYLMTLPASAEPSHPQEVGFPFSVRRGLGIWKALFLDRDWVMKDPATPQIARGRYLVETLGHCAQCHTPRGPLGELDRNRWLEGAPNPTGKGRIPGLTPDKLDWSADDIAAFLNSGLKPNFDTAGGAMADVIENWAQMPGADRAAVAAYLKALP